MGFLPQCYLWHLLLRVRRTACLLKNVLTILVPNSVAIRNELASLPETSLTSDIGKRALLAPKTTKERANEPTGEGGDIFPYSPPPSPKDKQRFSLSVDKRALLAPQTTKERANEPTGEGGDIFPYSPPPSPKDKQRFSLNVDKRALLAPKTTKEHANEPTGEGGDIFPYSPPPSPKDKQRFGLHFDE